MPDDGGGTIRFATFPLPSSKWITCHDGSLEPRVAILYQPYLDALNKVEIGVNVRHLLDSMPGKLCLLLRIVGPEWRRGSLGGLLST